MDRLELRTRAVAFWFAVLAAIGVSGLYLLMINMMVFASTYFPPGADILKEHFAAMIGLPAAAIISFILVVLLRQTEGPIEFEGLGFKFSGAAGQVVMWVLCFLAFAGALRLCWNP